MLIEKIVLWGIVLLFAALSAVLLSGKGAFLIAGYNTATKEAQAQYNEKKLSRVVGIGFSLMTLMIAIFAFYMLYEIAPPNHVIWILALGFIGVTIGMIVTGNTLCKNKDAPPNSEVLTEDPKKLDKLVKIAIPVVAFAWAAVLILLLLNNGEIKFHFDENAFYINAAPFSYEDILEVEYTNDFNLGMRTNGTSNFAIKAGNYKNDEFGNYKLYSYTNCKEYIILYTKEIVVVVNERDVSETQVLYENLLEKIE